MAKAVNRIVWNTRLIALPGEDLVRPDDMPFTAVTSFFMNGDIADVRPNDLGVFDPIEEDEWQNILEETYAARPKGCANCASDR